MMIFSEFSNAHIRYTTAVGRHQRKFMFEVIEFFCQYALRNKRLLHYWSEEKFGLNFYGLASVIYYRTVLEGYKKIYENSSIGKENTLNRKVQKKIEKLVAKLQKTAGVNRF